MSEGYIKLYKKMREWGWYSDPATKDVFLELLLSAAWTEGEYKGVKVKPGQCVVGRKELAKTLGLTEQNVRTALSHLEKTQEITKEVTNKFTLVTIVNWASYQGCDGKANHKPNQQLTSNQPTTNQQLTTLEESKKVRSKDIYIYTRAGEAIDLEDFVTAWNGLCPSLPKVQKMTATRAKKIKAILQDYEPRDVSEAMRRVEASDFLSGRRGGWKANFDWLMNPNNFVKVLEGNYEDRPRKTRTESEFEAARRRIQEQYERVTSAGTRTATG